jgi:hypothetical protein
MLHTIIPLSSEPCPVHSAIAEEHLPRSSASMTPGLAGERRARGNLVDLIGHQPSKGECIADRAHKRKPDMTYERGDKIQQDFYNRNKLKPSTNTAHVEVLHVLHVLIVDVLHFRNRFLQLCGFCLGLDGGANIIQECIIEARILPEGRGTKT